MTHVIIEDGIVITVGVDANVFARAIEAPSDIIFGDSYIDGEFRRVAPRPESAALTPVDQRERAYQSLQIVDWNGKSITVDEANNIYLEYSAERSAKADEIQELIIAAKMYVRNLYPD
jgi:hypothetical protein